MKKIAQAYTTYSACINLYKMQKQANNKPRIEELNQFFNNHNEKETLAKYGITKAPFEIKNTNGECIYEITNSAFDSTGTKMLLESIEQKLNRGGLEKLKYWQLLNDGVIRILHDYIKYKKNKTVNTTDYEIPFLNYIEYLINVLAMSFEGDDQNELIILQFLHDYIEKFCILTGANYRKIMFVPAQQSIMFAKTILQNTVNNKAYKLGFDTAARTIGAVSEKLYRLAVTLANKYSTDTELSMVMVATSKNKNLYLERATEFAKFHRENHNLLPTGCKENKGTLTLTNLEKNERAKKFISSLSKNKLDEAQQKNFTTKNNSKTKSLTSNEQTSQAILIDEILDYHKFYWDTACMLNKLNTVISMSPHTLIMSTNNINRTQTFLTNIKEKKDALFKNKAFIFLKKNLDAKITTREKINENPLHDVINGLENTVKESSKAIDEIYNRLAEKNFTEKYQGRITDEIKSLNKLAEEFCRQYDFKNIFCIDNIDMIEKNKTNLEIESQESYHEIDQYFKKILEFLEKYSEKPKQPSTFFNTKNQLLELKNKSNLKFEEKAEWINNLINNLHYPEKSDKTMQQKYQNIIHCCNEFLSKYRILTLEKTVRLLNIEIGKIKEQKENLVQENKTHEETINYTQTLYEPLHLETTKLTEKINEQNQNIDKMNNTVTNFAKNMRSQLEKYQSSISEIQGSFNDILLEFSDIEQQVIDRRLPIADIDKLQVKLNNLVTKGKNIENKINSLSNDTQAMLEHIESFLQNWEIDQNEALTTNTSLTQQVSLINEQKQDLFKKINKIAENLSDQKKTINQNMQFTRDFLSDQADEVKFNGGEALSLKKVDSTLHKNMIMIVPKHIKRIIDENINEITSSYNLPHNEFKQNFAKLLIKPSQKALRSMSFFRSQNMKNNYKKWSKLDGDNIDFNIVFPTQNT